MPEAIRPYASSFPPMIGLVGPPDQVKPVVKAQWFSMPQKTGSGPNDYTVNHISVLYRMGRRTPHRVYPADGRAAMIAHLSENLS